MERRRVVVIGSGFGGLFAAKGLAKAPVEVTLISRTVSHLFQPLLYQAATGILSTGEIAPATRDILKHQRNATVLLGEVTTIDLTTRQVVFQKLGKTVEVPYDYLVVAAGAGPSYFGNDRFAIFAPGMKTVDDALELRARIFGSLEVAELSDDPEERKALLTFVVVGAGPTGVEMVGQIAELTRDVLVRSFKRIDTRQARVVLLDAADAVLPGFAPKLSASAKARLEKIGVEVRLGARVTGVDETGVDVSFADGTTERIAASCKVWAAGVQASPLGKQLADQSGAEVDRAGRVAVNPDLTLPGHPEVFVLGDMMSLDRLPGVAQVALQGGKYTARKIAGELAGQPVTEPFRYKDKGSMAVVSQFGAVAQIGKLSLTGFLAWVAWLAVHLVYLVGFKNRLSTLLKWAITFLGRSRSERVTTEQQLVGRLARKQLGDDFRPTIWATSDPDRIQP
ncbi:MAG: NAD(P)/FAD-dependent oxidoreductase [Propionibacteriaceae bacterium]|nr:NAD(P)/FAD-dependent oxidoreductase [Propionibacteriaceae bacterium]